MFVFPLYPDSRILFLIPHKWFPNRSIASTLSNWSFFIFDYENSYSIWIIIAFMVLRYLTIVGITFDDFISCFIFNMIFLLTLWFINIYMLTRHKRIKFKNLIIFYKFFKIELNYILSYFNVIFMCLNRFFSPWEIFVL